MHVWERSCQEERRGVEEVDKLQKTLHGNGWRYHSAATLYMLGAKRESYIATILFTGWWHR